MIYSVIKDIIGIGADLVKGKREVEQAKTERKKEIIQNETDIQKLQIQKTDGSWKDEYITVLVTIPIFMCFIPALSDYALQGFETLSQTPEWYRYVMVGVISAAVGIKGWKNLK